MTVIIPAEILKHLIELVGWIYAAFIAAEPLLSCIGNADLASRHL